MPLITLQQAPSLNPFSSINLLEQHIYMPLHSLLLVFLSMTSYIEANYVSVLQLKNIILGIIFLQPCISKWNTTRKSKTTSA